jgi:DNA repair protein RadA/Sms
LTLHSSLAKLILKHKTQIKKLNTLYICKVCKDTQLSFTLKCRTCASFLSLEKIIPEPQILTLDELEITEIRKLKTPIDENLNEGLPLGSMTILAGVPGAGKSTLALEIINQILLTEQIPVLYISSEEPPEMIKIRALRCAPELIHNDNFKILCETIIERIRDAIKSVLTSEDMIIVLDSINAVVAGKSKSAPGSPSNIIKALNMLHNFRKTQEFKPTFLIISHANKQKAIAGPLTLQHMVDIVLFLDIEKDNSRTLTTLKNRFGPAGIKTTLNLPPY